MGKCKRLLMFAAFALAGIQTSWAQTFYEAVGFDEGQPLTEITPGQKVCLQNANSSTVSVLDTLLTGDMRTAITDASVWEFQVADEDEGKYYLYSPAAGKYLYVGTDPTGQWAAMAITSSRNNAEGFYVRQAVNYASVSDVPEDADMAAFTTDYAEGNFTLAFSVWGYPSAGGYHYYLGSTSAYFSTGSYNTWQVFPVREASGYSKLYATFNYYFPNGVVDGFRAGTEPGTVPQDIFDALQQAYDTAADLLNNEVQDADACEAAAAAIVAAYDAAKANVRSYEGYFYLINHKGASSAMYTSGSACYVNSGTWTQPETPGAADAPYIWKVTKVDGTEADYYFQNLYSGKYIGFGDNYSSLVSATDQPQKSYTVENFYTGSGEVTLRLAGSAYFFLHADGSNNVVNWTATAENSAWTFSEVSAEAIAALEEAVKQQKLNEELAALCQEAQTYYKKGFSYTSEATKDGNYDALGLVKDADHLWTNAQEGSEGPLANALDGDVTTYFHSRWNGNTTDNGATYHNLCADLGEAVSAISVKITKRMTATNPTGYKTGNAPGRVHFYATNDTTGFAAGDYTNWVDQGIVDFTYLYTAELNGTSYEGLTGINSCAFDDNFRFVRLDVEAREGGNSNSKLWFNLSEVRFYEATYDRENSLVENVEATLRQAFIDAMAAAQQAVAAGSATQQDIDSLQAAYDAYKAGYPDPADLKAAIAELAEYLTVAQESDAIGDFQDGAIAAMQAVIDELNASVDGLATIDEIHAAEEKFEAAKDEFYGKWNLPEDGKVYYIRCNYAGDAAHYQQYLRARGSSMELGLTFGGYSATEGEDANNANRLDFMWRAEKVGDRTFAFRNLLSGLYIGDTEYSKGAGVSIYQSEEPVGIKLMPVEQATTFALQTPSGTHLYFYGSVYADATVYYQSWTAITEVKEWGESVYVPGTFAAKQAVPYCLPFEVSAVIGEGILYEVSGIRQDGEAATLELIAWPESGSIPAGTPFFVVADEDVEGVNFFLNVNDLDDMVYSLEPQSYPAGFVAALSETQLQDGFCMFSGGKIIAATSEDETEANSAYLTGDLPVVTETGDLSLPMEAVPSQETGIASATAAASAAQSSAYDLQGRRVAKLTKGLYIVGGKKVYVK